MNPTQKIAQLRDEVEACQYDWKRTESRLRDAEKQLTLILVIMLAQTALFAAMVYTASLK
jgi:hypothetical protein